MSYIGSKPADAVLETDDITDGVVTTEKIADGTITSTDVNYPLTTFSSTGIDDNATANALTIDSSSNLQFNSGYGSVATAYGCRAWVNFNGTGTPAIRGSGNVSSITDYGTGYYGINFTTSMPDANYNFTGMASNTQNNWSSEYQGDARTITIRQQGSNQPSTSSIRVQTQFGAKNGSDGGYADLSSICVTIFR